jgi:phosphonate transport system permease protein
MTNREVKENSRRLFVLEDGSRIVEPVSKAPLIFSILLFFVVISWIVTDINLYNFFTRFGNFFDILVRMTQPNIEYLGEVIDPLIDTIQMSLLGSFLGAVFALPVAIISASNINKFLPVLWAARLLLSLLRTLPVLVYASMFAMLFYYGILPGVMAITVFTFAIMTKMLYERIETIDMGAFTAIEATGATKTKSFFTAVLPQIMGSFLSLSLYSFEINIRYAAILGYVGAGGIGLLLNDRMQWGRYDDVIVVLFVLFLTVITIETTSRYIRRRLG